jgi:hypothetical protein
MSVLDTYLKLKKQAESAQQEADKAEGALELLMKRLKEEFDCSSLKEAEKKLERLEKQTEDSKKEFEKAVGDFEKKWGNEI